MRNGYLIFLGFILLLSACKSDFERIRLSGDVDRIYQKANELYAKEDYLKAQTLYELIISSYRGKKEAEDLYFKYAYTHFHLKNYILAAHYFKTFTSTYPLSPLRQDAEYMVPFSFLKMSPGYRLDQTNTRKAIDGFQDFVNNYPKNDKVPECNRHIDVLRLKLEEKAFNDARLYFDLREYQAALHSFENLLKDFPETRDAENIRYLMAEAASSWAKNSFRLKQAERYNKALEYASVFRRKYPESTFISEINKIETLAQEALKTL